MIQLADATVMVNDIILAIVPNSLKFTEGFGEQNMRSASLGNGKTEQVYSRDVETALSKVMFDLHTTPENAESARGWKSKGNQNVVGIAGSTAEGDLTRTVIAAAMVNDPEIEIATEGVINVEFMGNSAI
jgi:hypothetical protein